MRPHRGIQITPAGVGHPQTPARPLSGRKVVFHLLRADESLANQVLESPFISEASIIDNKLLVTLDDPESHNPDVIRILVGAGADIQFVGELRRSLEDVYLQLIKNA